MSLALQYLQDLDTPELLTFFRKEWKVLSEKYAWEAQTLSEVLSLNASVTKMPCADLESKEFQKFLLLVFIASELELRGLNRF